MKPKHTTPGTPKMRRIAPALTTALVCQTPATAAGWTWSSLPSGGGPRVSGQTTSTAPTNNDIDVIGGPTGMLLFGGLTGAAGSPTTNDLWHFDGNECKWSHQSGSTPIDNCPRVRMYAASAMICNKFYIFGGWDPMEPGSGGEFLDDIWMYDASTNEWEELATKLPYPVSRHAATSVGNLAVIQTYKGILTFDGSDLTEQATTGEAPVSLSMCAMTTVGDTKVVVFGGSDKTQHMSSDVYALDTTTWNWTKLKCNAKDENDSPLAMASASMASLDADKCIVCGGAALAPAGYQGGFGLVPSDDTWVCTINEKEVQWERVICDNKPEGRVAASLSCVGKVRLVLQGGYDPVTKTTFDETWILSKDTTRQFLT